MVMNVSLWGPHSFETSTLAPPVGRVGAGANSDAPLLRMYAYLSHQVGSCDDDVCVTATAAPANASAARIVRYLMGPPIRRANPTANGGVLTQRFGMFTLDVYVCCAARANPTTCKAPSIFS